jgi:hypothetical protein
MENQPTEITVVVEVPPTETETPPPASSHGETTPALPVAVDLALTVGSLSARVEQLETRLTETETDAEAAQRTAEAAMSVALTTPEPTPEPEAEAEAVTLVEVPSSAAVDGPVKTPATSRGLLSRLLLG